MNKIIDYQLIGEDALNPQSLVNNVKEQINQGWQPLGSVFVILIPEVGMECAIQTMVKYEQLSEE